MNFSQRLNLGRLALKVKNSLGWTLKSGQSGNVNATEKQIALLYRVPQLQVLNKYLKNSQYDHLPVWDPKTSKNDADLRQTQPKIIFPMMKIVSDRISSKITAKESRLNFELKNYDNDKQDELDTFVEDSEIWSVLSSQLPSYFTMGSMFIRFQVSEEGDILVKGYESQYCYPIFDSSEKLESVEIRYVYKTDEVDENQNEIFRWRKISLGLTEDILYDSPEYDKEAETLPEFKSKDKMKHNLGFVQGEWFKTSHDNESHDGESLFSSSLDMLDSLNYRLSKEDDAVYYSIFPTLTAFGMELDDLEKPDTSYRDTGVKNSFSNTIISPRPPNEASINFLESSGTGLSLSDAFHNRAFQLLQYSMNSVLLDPEKLTGFAQSAKAMEIAHRPVIDVIKKTRPFLTKGLAGLIGKMLQARSDIEIDFKKDINKKWGDIFSNTIQDIAQKVQYTATALTGKTISQQTAVSHLAKDFGVENINEELALIEQDTKKELEDQATLDFNGTAGNTKPNTEPKPKGEGSTKGKK